MVGKVSTRESVYGAKKVNDNNGQVPRNSHSARTVLPRPTKAYRMVMLSQISRAAALRQS